MTEHTPTPWTLEVDTNETWSEGQVQTITIDAGDKLIATYKTNFVEYPETDAENAANAAFIIKAVNSHDTLVTALKMFLGHDDRFQVAVGGNPNAVEKMLEHARSLVGGKR